MRLHPDDAGYRALRRPGFLYPGEVSMEQFRLLADISGIYSERILLALELFLVRGKERLVACRAAGITGSCFSVKLRRLQDVSRTVVQLFPWYAGTPVDLP